jgi:hypothetical protein
MEDKITSCNFIEAFTAIFFEFSASRGLVLLQYFVFFAPGRVCVPIDPNHCDEFDPTTVPTLSQVNDVPVLCIGFGRFFDTVK